MREPFFQFLALGLLIWGAVEYWNADGSRYRIDIGSAEQQRIATTYLQQFGHSPTPDQLQRLIDRHIREEIFVREGLALQLEKNDEIVRRRIIQKYEFLQTDLAATVAPGEAVLKRWFEQNATRYRIPERIAFSHVYFSVDTEGEEAARQRAVQALSTLRAMRVSRAPDLGDSFPGPADVAALALPDAPRLFGQSELADRLFKLPAGQWSGPYRSGYGYHLVYITDYVPSRTPSYRDVREQALADYQEEQRRLFNARAFEKLKGQYTILYGGERR